MTKLIGLLGHPLGHSVSPAFQQAALDHLGLDICYQAWDVEPASLSSFMVRLRGPDYLGANVTIPYKEVALGLVDELHGLARSIGAVNTVVNREGRLLGYNTDAFGFLKALREDAGFVPRGLRAAVLGAGGAARAVCFSLAQEGISAVAIVNRTTQRATSLAAQLHALGVGTEVLSFEECGLALARCQLLVNCTPVGTRHSLTEGGSPLPPAFIPQGILTCDLVYNPPRTPLLRAAEARGARTLGGLPMLVYQGAESFRLWTGREPPLEVMKEAALEALEGC